MPVLNTLMILSTTARHLQANVQVTSTVQFLNFLPSSCELHKPQICPGWQRAVEP